MEKLYEFLNAQTGDALFGYALVFLFALGMITSMISSIFKSFNKRKNDSNTTRKNSE